MNKEQEILERLRDCVVDLDIAGVQEACKDSLSTGIPAYDAITKGLSKGLEIVGRKYEVHQYFLADLLMAGETMKEAMAILRPHLKAGGVGAAGKVVIGTVRGDLHDIGKNVVSTLLAAAGFDVADLGVDVSGERFVQEVRDKSDILAMSALLTTTMSEMENVIRQLTEAGLRSVVKVIVGGAPVSPEYGKDVGADAVGKDAVEGVRICKGWLNR